MESHDLVGQVFGSWRVLEKVVGRQHGLEPYWVCICSCGVVREVSERNLLRGRSKSCGCRGLGNVVRPTMYSTEKAGVSGSMEIVKNALHQYWSKIIEEYPEEVCHEWHDFSNFYRWALSPEFHPDRYLRRISRKEDWGPTNCRWLVPDLDNSNGRLYTKDGRHIREICDKYNYSYVAISLYIYRYSISADEAIRRYEAKHGYRHYEDVEYEAMMTKDVHGTD